MTLFGLDEANVRRLVAGVTTESELEDTDVADRFARAAWSVITEPGDGIAGTLAAELGAADALTYVLDTADRSRLACPAPAGSRGGSAGSVVTVGSPGVERMTDVPGSAPSQDGTARVGRATSAPDPIVDESHRTRIDEPPAGSDQLKAALHRWRPRLRSADVERALTSAARIHAELLVPTGSGGPTAPWPWGVDDLGSHAPIALWARGDPSRISDVRSTVALVGARAATGYGEHVASELSAGLADLGNTIVSGAAYGIDGTAHRAALAVGGLTFAFLAGGVDRFYPAGHDDLLRRVVEHGLVLSELPCGAAPTKWRFLQRNRLIAAASAVTVVVEAGARSGSLNTAGHAAALGRPLAAVPGPVTSPASAGCHRLFREYDAVCVTNTRDVAELIAPEASGPASAAIDGPETKRIVDALSTRAGRTADELATLAGLSVASTLAVLGGLELDRRVREQGGGWVAVSAQR
ncbi:DNA-protecting protein DprA [Planctomonas sp. JC2975]|uniref:DNA-processing protein DprA n=1 Tax=Planctomonas sp. JC2975 TaxID=2729626 RepID=UPI0014753180|nr:DNA-processing protein DprA [Planctomonas sp. JC2975]NNC10951.1 DNA-protecting protein DprA [Planctomonas sp. JC2975]